MQVKLDLYFEEKQFDVLLLTKLSSAKISFVQQSVLLRRHINFKMLDLDAYDFYQGFLNSPKISSESFSWTSLDSAAYTDKFLTS